MKNQMKSTLLVKVCFELLAWLSRLLWYRLALPYKSGHGYVPAIKLKRAFCLELVDFLSDYKKFYFK